MRLWMGETVEWFGGQITALALPTVAILFLNAGPFEMGLLGALNTIAYPILGLFVGVLADRWRRRPMMVWANIGQVIALGSIPLGFMFRMLSLNQLFAVALVMSVTTVFFVIAYQSYLPTLVDREDLVEGNAKLETSSSASLVFGPALGGLLIQISRRCPVDHIRCSIDAGSCVGNSIDQATRSHYRGQTCFPQGT